MRIRNLLFLALLFFADHVAAGGGNNNNSIKKDDGDLERADGGMGPDVTRPPPQAHGINEGQVGSNTGGGNGLIGNSGIPPDGQGANLGFPVTNHSPPGTNPQQPPMAVAQPEVPGAGVGFNGGQPIIPSQPMGLTRRRLQRSF